MQKIVEISEHDGIVAQEGVDLVLLKKSRLINFIEPFIVYGLALAIIWISGLDESLIWMYLALGILVLWILFVSPWWHFFKLKEKDLFLAPEKRNFWFWFFECRGLGSVKYYFQRDASGKPGFVRHWDAIMRMLLLWDVLFLALPFAFEKEYNEIIMNLFGNVSTLTRLGAILIAIVVADIILVIFIFPVMMRLDNFMSGWNIHLKWMTLVGVTFVVIFNMFFQVFWLDLQELPAAYAMKGDPPYLRLDQFNIIDFLGQMAGYVAWGWLQQLLFLSIFSTQFARAFDLKKDPKGVYLAAFFSALFFGLIHLPNFWLSIMTWTAGFFWAMVFMKNRNLMIMGVSHGLLGTLGNKLLPISYNVGPNSV
jgi:membrane protease YdiL (CAAX protease family)